MSFPQALSEKEVREREIPQGPKHITHRNVSRQVAARTPYHQKFEEVEVALEGKGPPLRVSVTGIPARRVSSILRSSEKMGILHGKRPQIRISAVMFRLTSPRQSSISRNWNQASRGLWIRRWSELMEMTLEFPGWSSVVGSV